MQDRVADVLAQRAALDNGFLAGVLLSIFLHGGITAAAIYAAMHTAPPQIASVLNIKFAPIRVPAAAVVKPAAPPKPTAPRIEPPKPQPVKPVETKAAPEKNTVPLSPFGKSTIKGSENPVVPATRQPSNPATQSSNPATQPPTQPVTFDGGDFPYTVYIDRMTTKLGAAFFRPQGTSSVVGVYFVIDRDGTIRDAKVESSSGNSTLDRAALRAVLESSPLGPLPFGYSGTYLGVHLKFR